MNSLSGKVSGVIEMVFDGARFKVRVDTEKYYINFQLNGVKALRTDANMPERLVFAQQAVNYGKSTLLQRNVMMDIESVDKYGICHGILFVNNKNYGLSLVSQGLGYINQVGRPSKIIGEVEECESKAKTAKIGLWSKFSGEALGIQASRSLKEVKNTSFRAILVEMLNPHDFYLQNVDTNELSVIEERIATEYDKLEKLKPPINNNTFCLAPFDNGLYRAKVLRKRKDESYDVQFIDYGNKDTVLSTELFKVPASVANYKPQAVRCSLAYVECAPVHHELNQSALNLACKQCWEHKLVAHVAYEDDTNQYVVIQPHNKPELKCSLNYTLLETGLARISSYTPPKGSVAQELKDCEASSTQINGAIQNAFNEEEEY